MRSWLLFGILIWAITITPAAAGGEGEAVHPGDEKERTYDPRTLFEYIDGAAELYLAYGFRGLTVRRFERAGRPPIIVELYEMSSPEDAYGVFSFEHQDEPVGIGEGSEFGGGMLRFWKGRYFVNVYVDGEDAGAGPAVLEVGRKTAAAIAAAGGEPRLIGYLPGKEFGLIDRSIRYLRSHVLLNQRFFISHQNILNLGRQCEATLAAYNRGGKKIHLLVIGYPDAGRAASALAGFTGAYMPDAEGKDRLRTEDRLWTIVRRKDNYFSIVFGAPAEGHAEALLGAVEGKMTSGRR